jgi:exopolysaccharide production protein ExoZ
LAVVVHHVLHEPYGGAGTGLLSGLPWEAGVDVFFVISGFVMVYSSSRLFAAPSGSRVFLRRRLARIVPLYWTATTCFLLVSAVLPSGVNAPSPTPTQILTSYAFIPWARPDGVIQPIYSLGWTLNYEMMFYAVFSVFLFLPRGRAVAAVAVALGCVVAAGRVFAPTRPMLVFWSDPIILEFVLGMALAVLAVRAVVLPSVARGVLAIVGLALLALMPADPMLIPRFLPGAACLVAAIVLGPDPRMPGIVATSMARMGDASYALYLVHPFVLRAVTLVWALLALTSLSAALLSSAAAVLLACCVALASFTLLEAPVTRGLTVRTIAARP